jgi:DNA-binding response OmpR family regulator/anti-sigma regulatory factor (Ser/Thr protein kinase)
MHAEPHHILVADDHSLSLKVLQSILRAGGYRVHPAEDGQAAWEILSRQPVGLVVADLRMPGLNGFELCQKIKEDPDTRLTPVIIVTAADDIASRIAAFEHGADDILPKPVINEELLARVGNLLRFSTLVRGQFELERAQAELERELALTQLRKEQEAARNRLYHDVLFAATGGRLQLMERDAMAPLLEDWSQSRELEITEPSQIARARQLAEEVAQAAGLDEEGISDAALCVSEAVTNALKFGTRVLFRGGCFEDQMRFVIEDDGPGLEHSLLPQVTLQKGFSTGASMGMGFSLMLEMMDRVGLCTGPDGTTVLLAKTVCQSMDIDLDSFLERFSVSLD